MGYEVAYIERGRDGRADMDREKTKRFDHLGKAMEFAVFVSNTVPIIGKPELRDTEPQQASSSS